MQFYATGRISSKVEDIAWYPPGEIVPRDPFWPMEIREMFLLDYKYIYIMQLQRYQIQDYEMSEEEPLMELNQSLESEYQLEAESETTDTEG